MDKGKLLLLKRKIKESCNSSDVTTTTTKSKEQLIIPFKENVLSFKSTKVIETEKDVATLSQVSSSSSSSSITTKVIETEKDNNNTLSQARKCISWSCLECKTECIPVRMESRCLCGHRLKEHNNSNENFSCKNSKCKCSHFFFIVAEGAWILRCRCKHKHIEHDCSRYPYKCINSNCKNCDGFNSPWVCNCGHSWSGHKQTVVNRSFIETGPQLQDIQHKNISFAVRQDGLLAKELRY